MVSASAPRHSPTSALKAQSMSMDIADRHDAAHEFATLSHLDSDQVFNPPAGWDPDDSYNSDEDVPLRARSAPFLYSVPLGSGPSL
jgi:hypothetical protein